MIKFRTGMRKQAWNRNVVAIGLAGGFLEPIESTSIHLIQSAIARLVEFFPDRRFSDADRIEFNRQSRFEYERVRDFIILHYHLNQRGDSAYWGKCAHMAIPGTWRQKTDLYRSRGQIVRVDNGLFRKWGGCRCSKGKTCRSMGAIRWPIPGPRPISPTTWAACTM